MTNEVWKSFDENALTHSAAHYLMTIHELLESQGYARVTDIAKQLNITRGSCSISLKPLKKRGLVLEDHNKFLLLSDEGKRLALLVEKNDELLETFFKETLGVSSDQAEVDACKIEYLLSIEASIKLCSFIELMQSDNPVVEQFRNLLAEHTQSCNHSIDQCPTCQNVCFFEQVEIEKKDGRAEANA